MTDLLSGEQKDEPIIMSIRLLNHLLFLKVFVVLAHLF